MVVNRPRARVETEPPRGQKMKQVHPQVAALGRVTAGEQGRNVDPAGRNLQDELFEHICIRVCLAVAIHQPEVSEQRVFEELLLRDDVESRAALRSVEPAYREFPLNDGPCELLRRLDFHESLAAVNHLDQEIRHDVAHAGILLSWSWRGGRAVEELNLEGLFRAQPLVPDGKGLLLDESHPGARH